MKTLLTLPGPQTKLLDTPPPPTPPPAQHVLIKVLVAGSNPKDWKMPEAAAEGGMGAQMARMAREGVNHGDDIAGIVEGVGSGVVEFKRGDRVAAFHELFAPAGGYAEYALAWSHTTFHLPEGISFEEAATIPLTALTASVSLYAHHQLPFPWVPAQDPIPLVIYGGSTAVGSFAIKLARNSNVHPIVAIAGKGVAYVSTLLDHSQGDAVVDYRDGPEATVRGVTAALKLAGHKTARHALDTVATRESVEVLKKVVAPDGQMDFTLENGLRVFPAVKTVTHVGSVHRGNAMLGYVMSRYFTRALQEKQLVGHPFEVREGGLEGVEQGLKDLKAGRASAVKYVYRIGETRGVEL
ncbi:hypothetical protein FQN52_004587 [Onygenales sp. PD_12]|nr:hypothetical protein FQN52_004587 [Onygenales sp. PD_12]